MSGQFNPDPNRPEVSYLEVIHLSPEKSVIYQEVGGSSPEITNHLSHLDINVLRGVGVLATRDVRIQLQSGSSVSLTRGTRYKYEGTLDLEIISQPALHPNFVTFDNEKLGPLQRMVVREIAKAERKEARRVAAREAFRKLFEQKYPQFEQSMLYMMRAEESLHPKV